MSEANGKDFKSYKGVVHLKHTGTELITDVVSLSEEGNFDGEESLLSSVYGHGGGEEPNGPGPVSDDHKGGFRTFTPRRHTFHLGMSPGRCGTAYANVLIRYPAENW